jgi:hypothetical protein
MSQKKPEHHWVGRKPNPDKYFGFVYEITNLVTGKKYIGKKQYHRWSKRKKIGSSNWETYTSSSTHVNADIKKYGKDMFEFRILKNYHTRGGLVYGEANLQHKKDVLTKREGEERVYLNGQIGAIRFIPKEW